MKTTSYTKQTRTQVEERLQDIATGFAAIYGCKLINSDMTYAIESFYDECYECNGGISYDYYFVITKSGVINGSKSWVEFTADPVCIIKICKVEPEEWCSTKHFTITITIK